IYGWGAKGVLLGSTKRREAQVLLRSAADLALEVGNLERASVSLGNLSDIAFSLDRYEEALGYLEASLEVARKEGNRPNEWFVHSEMSYAHYQLGHWEEALQAFAEVPEERLPSGLTLLSPLTGVLELYLHRG